MKLLPFLLIISPLTVSAQRYRGSPNPNDEPFLPIFPVYPYTPKLVKRGTEKDFLSQLKPEVFAPKPEASRGPYSSSYSGHYPRNTHNPTSTQTSYSSIKSPSAYNPTENIPSPYYNVNPYLYAIYNGYPVTLVPQQQYSSAPLYPNYDYQQQYYYPNQQQSYSAQIPAVQRGQKNELNNPKDGQLFDGTNYLSTSTKDLDGQPSTYKQPTIANQLEESTDLRTPQAPARTMYRLIPYDRQQGRQPVLSPGYKYQQLDQLIMTQAMGKVFAQPIVTQSQYDVTQNSQVRKPPSLTSNAPVMAKTGLTYVMPPAPFNIVPPPHIAKAPESYQLLESSAINAKGQRPMTTVTLEASHSAYIPPVKTHKNHEQYSTEYVDYSPQMSQFYVNPNQRPVDYKKTANDESYQYIPQAQTYQYSSYHPASSINQQLENYKYTLDDINYASKRNIKMS